MTRPSRGNARSTRLTRSPAKRASPRAQGRIKQAPPNWFLINPMLREAGVYVTAETASQVAAVYGCCRIIVDSIAPAPVNVVQIKPGGAREILHDDPVSWVLNYGAEVTQAPDAPPAQAVEEALLWSALMGDGNGYAEIQWDNSGKFFGLWPIESDRVTPKRDETGYYYEVSQAQGGVARVEAWEMFHLRGPSLKGWVGDSVVYRASKAIGIAIASQVYSGAYFANGTNISGLLTTDKNLTPAQAKDAKAKWNEDHGGGPGRSHGISVLGAGVKYQPLNHTAQESMLVDARRFQVEEVCRFYGIPTALLAQNEAWTSLSELYLGTYRTALLPWISRFDQEASRKLFPRRNPWREVSHDLTHLTLGNFKDQVAALTQATGNKPIWTQNEARAIFGKNSVPGGDTLEEPKPEPVAAPKPTEATDTEDPEEDDAEDTAETDSPTNVARKAAEVFYAQALERHAGRVAKGMDAAKSMAKLQVDCDAAVSFLSRAGLKGPNGALTKSADAVLVGQPPEDAAALLAGGLEHA